jgi:hypothetical protein
VIYLARSITAESTAKRVSCVSVKVSYSGSEISGMELTMEYKLLFNGLQHVKQVLVGTSSITVPAEVDEINLGVLSDGEKIEVRVQPDKVWTFLVSAKKPKVASGQITLASVGRPVSENVVPDIKEPSLED